MTVGRRLTSPATRTVLGPSPTAALPDGPPTGSALRQEMHSLLQPLRLARRSPALARAPRGDGRVVIDVPGWRAPEASMAPLRTYLRALGHDARTWGLGTNLGDPEGDSRRLVEVVEQAARTSGRTVHLVGWSLGGVVARETARLRPDLVERVVTYGTPVIGGPTHTIGARAYGDAENRRIADLLVETDRADPITVPITAIFTRRDRIVNWLACLDRTSLDVTHVEVRSTHLGLGIDPDVWLTVAESLATAPRGSVGD